MYRFALLIVVIVLLSVGAQNQQCEEDDCYRLVTGDINDTADQVAAISGTLERISFNLTATLEQLDEAARAVNNTFGATGELNSTQLRLQSSFVALRNELDYSQQELTSIASNLSRITANISSALVQSSSAAALVNRTVAYITESVTVLDQFEANVLPILEDLAVNISQLNDSGVLLVDQLVQQLQLVTDQSLQLTNFSELFEIALNLTTQSLINADNTQDNVAAEIAIQTVVIQNVSSRLVSLSAMQGQIRSNVRDLDDDLTIEEMKSFPVVSMDLIIQAIQSVNQLVLVLQSLLNDANTHTITTANLYNELSSHRLSLSMTSNQIQTAYTESVALSTKVTASLAVNSTIDEVNTYFQDAERLLNVLSNFSDVALMVNESLQSVQAIQMTALEGSNTANQTASTISEIYTLANNSLSTIMEASFLAGVIEMTLNTSYEETANIVQDTTGDRAAVQANRSSLQTAQEAVNNVTEGFTAQQADVNATTSALEQRRGEVEEVKEQCTNASQSLEQLQSDFDNLSYLSKDDIAGVRARLMSIASQLTAADVANMTSRLQSELERQRRVRSDLEEEVTAIETEVGLLRQIHDSLPQSCS